MKKSTSFLSRTATVVKHMSRDPATLFLAAIVVSLVHIGEMVLLMDWASFHVPHVLSVFQNFDDPNLAFLILMFTIVAVWIFTLSGAFRGGRAASMPLLLFGLILTVQFYHLVREWDGTLQNLYYPGMVTGVVIVGIGILMLREGYRALRGNQ